MHVWILLDNYGIDHVKSRGNGQTEATNKTLLRVFSIMIYEEPKAYLNLSYAFIIEL